MEVAVYVLTHKLSDTDGPTSEYKHFAQRCGFSIKELRKIANQGRVIDAWRREFGLGILLAPVTLPFA